jgi:predicted dehydrogenase
MAHDFAWALRGAKGARVLAFVSRDLGRAQAAARRFRAPLAFDDLGRMLAVEALDVVYVATPHHLHLEHGLSAIAAGKAVLIEKPLALTAAEGRAIRDAAQAAGVFCMEAMWTHFIPAVAEAFRLVESGAVGAPLLVCGSFGASTPFNPAARFFDAARGGGALLDRGCYPISLALRLLGRPSEVEAVVIGSAASVDVTAAATLRFPSGAVAQIAASLAGQLPNAFHIGGASGLITLHGPMTRPTRLTFTPAPREAIREASHRRGPRSRLGSIVRGDASLSRLRAALTDRSRFFGLVGDGYGHEIAEVRRCLEEGRGQSPTLPLALSISTLEVIDQIRAAQVG